MLFNILLDLILIMILVLGSYFGYTRGLFRMIVKPLRLIACLWLSFAFSRAVADMLVLPLIDEPITNLLKDFLYERCLGLDPSQAVEEIPTLIKIAAALFDVGIDYSADTIGIATEQTLISLIAPTIKFLSIVISFLLLLISSRLAVGFIIEFIDAFLNLGVIGGVNRFLGIIASCAFAFASAWLLASGLDFLFHSAMFGSFDAMQNFVGGPIYSFFLDFSLIRLLFSF